VEKAEEIREKHSHIGKEFLDFAIVEDVGQEGAFDEAVISNPPFEIVIHTASPFILTVTNPKRDLIDPAINGTIGILKSIKAGAPSVKRVVGNLPHLPRNPLNDTRSLHLHLRQYWMGRIGVQVMYIQKQTGTRSPSRMRLKMPSLATRVGRPLLKS
jgi:hypothetical protein